MDGWSPSAIKAELLLPGNSRLCHLPGLCIDYESVEEFYREDLELCLGFGQLEEYYARCYPPGSEFNAMVANDLIYVASFVRHLEWMRQERWDRGV